MEPVKVPIPTEPRSITAAKRYLFVFCGLLCGVTAEEEEEEEVVEKEFGRDEVCSILFQYHS